MIKQWQVGWKDWTDAQLQCKSSQGKSDSIEDEAVDDTTKYPGEISQILHTMSKVSRKRK